MRIVVLFFEVECAVFLLESGSCIVKICTGNIIMRLNIKEAIMIGGVLDGFLPLLPVLALGAVITLLVVIGSAFLKKSPEDSGQDFSSYTSRSFLLSKAEFSFYQVLCQVLGDKYCVYPKVRLADIVKVKWGKQYYADFNRIKSKHTDFVVCEKSSKIILVVELDDKSHTQQKSKKGDIFKDDLFKAIGIRCIRCEAKSSYNVEEVKRKLIPQKAIV